MIEPLDRTPQTPPSAGVPRWVKVLAAAFILAAVLFVVMIVGARGLGRQTPRSSPVQSSGQRPLDGNLPGHPTPPFGVTQPGERQR
jgi:hypothetical protein